MGETKVKKWVGYVRIFSDSQMENTSIGEQVRQIEAFCVSQGWQLAAIFKDEGISGNTKERAECFLKEKRPGGEIVAFDMPKWLDDFVKETAIPQKGYKKNALNQGGHAPKVVDPSTPGDSYEFPPIWSEWFEEYAKNGRIIKDVGD
ncbi:recombinase family protein [Paenibacillus maysiensis]|uniref:recombinase family protein n=1 Tax=Paenibacillus maysiensis TaxID=1155954 RepID=UPI00046EB446|nr:recombinase family protein [Paenibacillus maysiensis]